MKVVVVRESKREEEKGIWESHKWDGKRESFQRHLDKQVNANHMQQKASSLSSLYKGFWDGLWVSPTQSPTSSTHNKKKDSFQFWILHLFSLISNPSLPQYPLSFYSLSTNPPSSHNILSFFFLMLLQTHARLAWANPSKEKEKLTSSF